jgi:adenylosuccinate lyase
VNTGRIAERVSAELPLMATERIILRAVSAGTDRQRAHEIVRRHSAAADDGQSTATFLDRLASDPELGLSRSEVAQAVNPRDFIGRAPQQVDEFLDEVIGPLLEGHRSQALRVEIRV